MIKTGYQKSGRWTPREIAVWLSALIVTIIVGILFATGLVGSWVLLVQSVMVITLGLLRYRVETKGDKRSADDDHE